MLVNRGGTSHEAAQLQAEAYRVAHGLNDPLPIQYLNWLWGIITRFDFGDSLYYNKPVSAVVLQRLPPTIMIALTCHILATGHRHHPRDHRRHPAVQLGRHRCLASSPSSA